MARIENTSGPYFAIKGMCPTRGIAGGPGTLLTFQYGPYRYPKTPARIANTVKIIDPPRLLVKNHSLFIKNLSSISLTKAMVSPRVSGCFEGDKWQGVYVYIFIKVEMEAREFSPSIFLSNWRLSLCQFMMMTLVRLIPISLIFLKVGTSLSDYIYIYLYITFENIIIRR